MRFTSQKIEIPKQPPKKPKPANDANQWIFWDHAAQEKKKVRTEIEKQQREHREAVRQRMSARRAAEELMSELSEVWE